MTLVIIFAILAIAFDIFLLAILGMAFGEELRFCIRCKRYTQELWVGIFYLLGVVANASVISLYLYQNFIINYV